MRTLTRRVAALAIVSSLTLAGCGGSDGGSDDSSDNDSSSSATTDAPDDDTDTDSGSDVAPATGDVISGTGFSFNAPEGWTDAKDVLPSALAVAANRSDADGFSDNINVIEDKTIVDVDRDDLEAAVKRVLEGVNAQDVTIKDPVDVSGEEAVTVAAVLEQNGTKYRTEQFAVSHDGKGYVVTFSFSDTVSEDDREDLTDSVLETWKWS
ncbi:hypothetical protein [Aeromicrobium sp. Root472D3]|uniref:hypothetical protein n=1 Tax=Aeromicrobium sp. Root472D3 TaxID=1736540 RepID=UPI0006F79833|nr:hypothetical protein [Aeromicrobium sp. Root472D3]KQX73942.1 hypothetical protein ASD10_01340 [Aeromicrobium sp. Root472D3]